MLSISMNSLNKRPSAFYPECDDEDKDSHPAPTPTSQSPRALRGPRQHRACKYLWARVSSRGWDRHVAHLNRALKKLGFLLSHARASSTCYPSCLAPRMWCPRTFEVDTDP